MTTMIIVMMITITRLLFFVPLSRHLLSEQYFDISSSKVNFS